MGKKKGKKKGSGAKPNDPKTLPFLQEMFSNIDKEIVSIVYEQMEHDEEKTIQQLEELSMNDGTEPSFGGDNEEEDYTDMIGTSLASNSLPTFTTSTTLPSTTASTTSTPSTTSNTTSKRTAIAPSNSKASKRATPPPFFMSTDDSWYHTNHTSTNTNTSSTTTTTNTTTSITSTKSTTSTTPPSSNTFSNTASSPPNKNKRNSPQNTSFTSADFISTSPPHHSSSYSFSFASPTSTASSITPSKSSPASTNSTPSSSSANSYTDGSYRQFLSAMFPELDSTMIDLVFEENGNDMGKTVESLLSIVFMNHGGNGEDDAEDEEEEVEGEAEGDDGEEGEGDEEYQQEEEYTTIEEKLEESGDDEHVGEEGVDQVDMGNFKFELPPVATKDTSEPPAAPADTPRTLLALELDELDCDLEKTIESCCRADPDYLKRLSGEEVAKEAPEKEVRSKFPAAVTPVKPTWYGAGSSPSHSSLVKTKYAYVKPKKQEVEPQTATTTRTSTKRASKPANAAPKPRPMDLAAKLKLKQLREKFSFVDPDILEAVFVQSDYTIQATLVCLYDIYPHLRDSTAGAAPSKATRKREQPEAKTPKPKPPQEEPKKEPVKKTPKRTKPTTEEGQGEFVTITYRKKKNESTAPRNKFMDTDDIENAYHNYREEAIKAQEMRDHLFREAAAAFQAGDGARAKALSQRGRDYNEKMNDSHKQACHQIFIDCNARLDTLASVDLHGLHVAEALHVVGQLLEVHEQMGETSKPKTLRVITGQGRHSIGGVAKIKPAVKEFLRNKSYTFREADAGVITIELSKH